MVCLIALGTYWQVVSDLITYTWNYSFMILIHKLDSIYISQMAISNWLLTFSSLEISQRRRPSVKYSLSNSKRASSWVSTLIAYGLSSVLTGRGCNDAREEHNTDQTARMHSTLFANAIRPWPKYQCILYIQVN